MEDKTIQLKTGRLLAYTDYGDNNDTPVFFIHGNPGSRLIRRKEIETVLMMNARLITPDRPGYGFSDFCPERKLTDFPDDIAQLADALHIDKFALFGFSAGGPYVAACAYKIPERITNAAIISGSAPIDRKGACEGMNKAWRTSFEMSKILPSSILRLMIWMQAKKILHTPDDAITELGAILSDADKKVLRNPDVKEWFKATYTEAVRHGVKGWTKEAKIIVSPWGFKLEDIPINVDLWYWEDDPVTPIQMGKYMENKIPKTHARFLPGGGHFSIIDSWEKIIESII